LFIISNPSAGVYPGKSPGASPFIPQQLTGQAPGDKNIDKNSRTSEYSPINLQNK